MLTAVVTLGRAWRDHVNAWILWSLAVAGCVPLALWGAHAWQQARAETLQLDQLQTDSTLAAGSSPPAPAAPADFTASLPTPPGSTEVLHHLRTACATAGVALVSVDFVAHAPAPEALGRLDANITLRGPYSAIKLVTKEMLERHPGATVSHLRIRRGAQPAELEARLVLAVWSPAAGGGR